jgi:hypothetical protein
MIYHVYRYGWVKLGTADRPYDEGSTRDKKLLVEMIARLVDREQGFRKIEIRCMSEKTAQAFGHSPKLEIPPVIFTAKAARELGKPRKRRKTRG